MDYGDEAVDKHSFASAQRGFGDVGRVRTEAGGDAPPVILRRIGKGHCEELVLRQKHSVHVVAEAHLTVVRAMVRKEEQMWVQRRRVNAWSRVWKCNCVQSRVRRAEAARALLLAA